VYALGVAMGSRLLSRAALGAVVVVSIAAAPHAAARNVFDHGSTVEGGCGAYWVAKPDPATTSDELTLRIDFACASYAWIASAEAHLWVGPGANAYNVPLVEVSPSSCTQTASGSLTCVYPPQPPGVYSAVFDWFINSSFPASTGGATGSCVQYPENAGVDCRAVLNIVVH
jgi:hypothetical protein